MRKRRQTPRKNPRSIIQLAGMKIKAGASLSYHSPDNIISPKKTGGCP